MHFCIVLAEIEPFNNKCEPFSNISSHCSVRAAGNTTFRIGKYGRSYLPAWAVADAFKGSRKRNEPCRGSPARMRLRGCIRAGNSSPYK